MGGWIAGMRAWYLMASLDNCHWHAGKRHSINLTGCGLDFLNCTLDGGTGRVSSIKFAEGQAGNGLQWVGGYLDFEGPYPREALFDLTQQSGRPGSSFHFEGVGLPEIPDGEVAFLLRPRTSVTAYPSPATLTVKNCDWFGNIHTETINGVTTVVPQNGDAMCRVLGTGWDVRVEGNPDSGRPLGVPLVIDAVGGVVEE